MQSLSERTAGFTDSVIRRMTRVSMQYDAVNLSQGFPDFEPPKKLLDIAEFGYESDLAFCEDLAHYVGVVAVPGSSFFREPVNNLIRLHFAKKDETLLDALNRLEGLRDKIKPKHR